jgi:hypothetical protein
METMISTAALPFSGAPIAMNPRLSTPAFPIDTTWRRDGGAVLAAGATYALMAEVSVKQVDHSSVAKQAGPPRGSRLVG